MSILASAFVALAPAAVAAAPTPPPTPVLPPQPHLRAVRTATRPVLDGKIDDAVWKLAPPGTNFTQKVPKDGAKVSDPTTVRVLYDDDAIYVAFDCPQDHTPVTERLTRRDRMVEVDAVEFDLGTRGDHKSSFEFYVNSSGTLADSLRYNDTDSSSDWDENWEARTNVTAHGWTAEFRIPLRVLRFPSLPVQSWDFEAIRYISLKQELDYWAYFPRSVAGEVSHYGRLDDLRGLQEKDPIELRPFVVGRVRRRDPGQGQLASGWDGLASGGLDVKWHPTQDLTLDATLNPDFAQVEADQVVLNLSTVETYYPEKRPFFLEGIDALTTPFQLLYTRRIGQVPPLPTLRTDNVNNEYLVNAPEPSPIYGAMKLTGRLADKWSIATVQALTAENDIKVQLADGSRVNRVVDPLSAFNVVRLKRDFGSNAHVAFMATAVTHAETTGNYPLLTPGAGYATTQELCPIPVELSPLQSTNIQLRPRARCFNDAYVGATDWRWRSPSGDYSITGQVAASTLQNGPTRPVADGTLINPGDIGWAAKTSLNKDGGVHWIGNVSLGVDSPKFEINDVGYNDRANIFAGAATLEYRDLDPGGPFLENHTQLNYSTQYDWIGLMVGQGLYLSDSGRLKNFWGYYADVHYRGTKFDDREVGDGTALQRDGRVGNELSVGTDTTKRVSVSVDQITDVVYDGFNMNGSATVSVRVLPQFDFDLLPTWQWTFGEPRFMAAGDTSGQYLFGKLDAKSLGLTLRTTYTFAPRITLQAYAQLFLASGHYTQYTQLLTDPSGPRPAVQLSQLSPYTGRLSYSPDFEEGILNINLVLRWEYRLGSILYLVYTRSQSPTTVLGPDDVGTLNLGAIGQAPASDAVLAKLSFWWGG